MIIFFISSMLAPTCQKIYKDSDVASSSMSMNIFSISSYSLRIHTLKFSLYEPFSFPNDKFRRRLPLLTKLAVTILTEHNRPVPPVMMTAFRDASLLREVRLSGASLQWISLPWVQLTHSYLSDESPSWFLQILKETPNLEVLALASPDRSNSSSPLLHDLTLPNLHTLEFFGHPEGKLLERLGLPALKTIHLANVRDPEVSWFLDLGVRSAWSSRSMRLSYMKVDNFIACLQSLASVTEVHIHLVGSGLNQLLILLHEGGTIVPALQILLEIAWQMKIVPCRPCGKCWHRDRAGTRWDGQHEILPTSCGLQGLCRRDSGPPTSVDGCISVDTCDDSPFSCTWAWKTSPTLWGSCHSVCSLQLESRVPGLHPGHTNKDSTIILGNSTRE
ncbi:hypothetical protein MSAN_01706800 [Mycena sanguinolenta]|uniref:Uncharacterized protein n=1 Tax=Mycena sanguinolenta TaxID=230812 RepID=A0A8H6XZF7_9AGAR|nr:hypothetical protein MSAN_01706800 [Mycena sanguinolenta]